MFEYILLEMLIVIMASVMYIMFPMYILCMVIVTMGYIADNIDTDAY